MKKIFVFILAAVTLGACNKRLDELLVNPNSPSPDKANADLYLIEMQTSFASMFNSAEQNAGSAVRMYNLGAFTYNNAYTPETFNGIWSDAYTGVIRHADALIPVATQQRKWVNVGMAYTLKAYTLMTLVDLFGDIPYSESNKGSDVTNPKADKGSDVYAASITMLDSAIAAFGRTSGAYPGTSDFFFGAADFAGSTRWRRVAKLLKLRALNTTRLVNSSARDQINTLLGDADISASLVASNDFEFKYSTKQANPNSRHPEYNGAYQPSGGAGGYMATHMMWMLAQEKGTASLADPRLRYYFYRQTGNFNSLDGNSASCSVAPRPSHYLSPAEMPYCVLEDAIPAGYWGRDHGDGSGIPPDNNYRTTYGIYPVGGAFDDNVNKVVSLNMGGQGAGVLPLWQSSFTEFLKAECALTLGTTGNPRTLLESAIRKSMSKVLGFPATIGVTVPATYVPSSAVVDAYVNKVLALYDAAGSNDQRLNIIEKEWFIASWGNGMDVYNNYRRTGKPANLQFTKLSDFGTFPRSMYYPADYIQLNQNAEPKQGTSPTGGGLDVQVFWDNNPAGFIK